MCYSRYPLPVTCTTARLVLLNHRNHVLALVRKRWDGIGTNLCNLLFMEISAVFSRDKHVYSCNYMLSPDNYWPELESPFPKTTWVEYQQYSDAASVLVVLILCSSLSALKHCFHIPVQLHPPASLWLCLSSNNLKLLCFVKRGDNNLTVQAFLL